MEKKRKINPRSLANLRPKPWKPGQSGNPAGRPSAGSSVREWINTLAHKTEAEWRKIASNTKEIGVKRMAAIQLLRAVEIPDMADYEDGTLAELRERGVNTTAIKKLKIVKPKKGAARREIELYDRVGDALDRIMDRTEGKPKQSVDVTHDGSIRTTAEGETEAASLLARLTRSLGLQ